MKLLWFFFFGRGFFLAYIWMAFIPAALAFGSWFGSRLFGSRVMFLLSYRGVARTECMIGKTEGGERQDWLATFLYI